MLYFAHQIKASDRVLEVMRKRGVSLLAGETRTGKTRVAIRVAELSKAKHVLVLTKKAAIAGWTSELEAVKPKTRFTVTNYEQAAKLADDFDLLVLDESHNLGRPGKPSKRFKIIRTLAYKKPLLCLSGTPMVETKLSIYYQFALPQYSPFKTFKSFYRFFDEYGLPSRIRVNGYFVEQYVKAKPELLAVIEPYIITLTQDKAGIAHKAIDKVHEIELLPATIALLEQIKTDKVATIAGVEYGFDSDMGERAALHQLEAGAVKLGNKFIMLPNTELVDYIRKEFGDKPSVAVMCHYHSTREKIKQHLPNVQIYSSNAHAEGVDLSHYEHFIIANSAYSGAKFVQRRDRIVNINRTSKAVVHHLVAKKQLSAAVYAAVCKKHDFNLELYRHYARTATTV